MGEGGSTLTVSLTVKRPFFYDFPRLEFKKYAFIVTYHASFRILTVVDKIKKSVYLSPDKVKAFLETMLENWPAEFPVPDSSAPRE